MMAGNVLSPPSVPALSHMVEMGVWMQLNFFP